MQKQNIGSNNHLGHVEHLQRKGTCSDHVSIQTNSMFSILILQKTAKIIWEYVHLPNATVVWTEVQMVLLPLMFNEH